LLDAYTLSGRDSVTVGPCQTAKGVVGILPRIEDIRCSLACMVYSEYLRLIPCERLIGFAPQNKGDLTDDECDVVIE